MTLQFVQVDAFTDSPYAGNPAVVILLPSPREKAWMQRIAREMNLSETAFLVRRETGGFELRWFTPTVEVELCGHATLASAHALFEQGILKPGELARFFTKSGELTASQSGAWIQLDFPARREEPVTPPAGLADALGVKPLYVGRNVYDYLVLVDSEAAVEALDPNQSELRRLDVRGVMVTAAAATPGFDFVSRFFAPGSGIDEDPVTGSAHCCLGPFWEKRLGRSELVACQISKRRGVLRVSVRGDRVLLGGQAVTVLRGELVRE